jgi:hypothetical protein
MYCSACGKKCPEGARFCAWCGEKLPEIDPAAAPEAPRPDAEFAAPIAPAVPPPEPEEGAPEAPDGDDGAEPDVSEAGEPEPAADPMHRMFQRPPRHDRVEDARTVRPLSANPAQPLRGEQAEFAESAPETGGGSPDGRIERRQKAAVRYDDDDEWVRPPRRRADPEGGRTAGIAPPGGPPPPRRAGWGRTHPRPARPGRHAAEDHRGEKPPRGRIADRLLPRSAHGKAVTASGGVVTPPSRRPPTRPAGPFRSAKRSKNDLFFEDLAMPRENFYDEAAEERALSRRIKGIVALAVLAGAVIVAIWMMWMPGGQIFRARWNLGAPAAAYKAMGDQDRAGGQLARAAAAYHNALKLDPDNYAYALLVGQTYDMIGDRENAVKAYMICVQLKPAEAQPYEQLVDIYTVMGDGAAAEKWREKGYKQTGDAALAPAGTSGG